MTYSEETERKRLGRKIMENRLKKAYQRCTPPWTNDEGQRLTPAIAMPSYVEVPRPSSSRMTSDFGPASRRILDLRRVSDKVSAPSKLRRQPLMTYASSSSTRNVDWLANMLS